VARVAGALPQAIGQVIGSESLVQSTLRRLVPPFDAENVRVVCGSSTGMRIARHMEAIGIPAGGRIISEPRPRNTAPAILLACLRSAPREDAVLGDFPADHVIGNLPAFHEKLAVCRGVAAQGRIVTFASTPITPRPATVRGGGGSLRRAPHPRFVEKPDLDTPAATWRPGISSGTAHVRVPGLRDPGGVQGPSTRPASGPAGPLRVRAADPRKTTCGCRTFSIDYAVMEKPTRESCWPSDSGGATIGS